MNPRAQAIGELLAAHRSIRRFEDRAVDPVLIDAVLVQGLQGSSSSGNLNMVSVIKTFDRDRRARLFELHFEQPMVLQAPLVLTFCADTWRTRSPASASTVPSLTPRLEWNASSGATTYGLQVATSSAFTTLLINETGITNLYYDIAPGILNWNTPYYWRVNARNSFGSTSSWSSCRYFTTAIGPPPNAPSNLVATPISSSRIDLSRQDNSGDETGFKIERKTGSGSYAQIATVGAGVTSYSNTYLSASTTYYYRGRAYKGTLNSDYCGEAFTTTLPPPPSAPTLKSPAWPNER